jgi:hypothetical protein
MAGYIAALLPILAITDRIVHHRYAEMLRDWPLFSVVPVVAIAIGYGCPRTISVDDAGVRQSPYLGVGAKTVRWDGAHAAVEPNTGKVCVCGAAGEQVVHNPRHSDRLGFIIQLESRIKVYKFGNRP